MREAKREGVGFGKLIKGGKGDTRQCPPEGGGGLLFIPPRGVVIRGRSSRQELGAEVTRCRAGPGEKKLLKTEGPGSKQKDESPKESWREY